MIPHSIALVTLVPLPKHNKIAVLQEFKDEHEY